MASDRETVIRLRHDLQACMSRHRVALVAATELQAKLLELGMILPIRTLDEFTSLRQLVERLVQLLSQEGGGR